jgi:hypothetical protein
VFEVVHTITDYYDAPRAGTADFHGAPHHYVSEYADFRGPGPDVFRLWPISRETFELAVEDWAIWLRWEAEYHAGRLPNWTDDQPMALGADLARHSELERVLHARLAPPTAGLFRATGRFRLFQATPRRRWPQHEVEWTPLG